jgi:hypothetical protein
MSAPCEGSLPVTASDRDDIKSSSSSASFSVVSDTEGVSSVLEDSEGELEPGCSFPAVSPLQHDERPPCDSAMSVYWLVYQNAGTLRYGCFIALSFWSIAP